MLKMLVMVSEERRCVADKGRKKCREASLGGMRAATQHSCFSAQYRCALESELYSCGIDLHVAHYGCCCYGGAKDMVLFYTLLSSPDSILQHQWCWLS